MRRASGLYVIGVCFLVFFMAGLPAWGRAADAPKPGESFVWKLQCNFPPPEKTFGFLGTYGRSMELARKVKERTKGGLDIKVFPPGALFKEFESLDAVKKGALEMITSTGSSRWPGRARNLPNGTRSRRRWRQSPTAPPGGS